MLTIDEISNLYVMYNELCSFNFQNKNWENTLKYFYKTQKYFNLVYEDIIKNDTADENKINNVKNNFLSIKNLAITASKELGYDTFTENIPAAALDEYEKILHQENKKDVAYAKLSELLNKAGANISAINFLKKSLQINPNNHEYYRLIGDYYSQLKDYPKAIAFYEKFNELSPGNPLVYNSLGTLYSLTGRYDDLEKQIEYFKKALEILPKYEQALQNLAIAYRHYDKDKECCDCYRKLIELYPSADNYFNYACQQIKLENFEEGWKYFEYRFDRKPKYKVFYPQMPKPRWDGIKDLQDKVLLVQYEQGFGDSLQFFRYLPQIKTKKTIFRVQDGLVELFKYNTKDIEIIGKSTPVEEIAFDYHVPIMSLPYLLNFQIETIPLAEGYIKADNKKIEKYKQKFFNNDCLKIGITWKGASWGNEKRNIPIEFFNSLAELKNVKVYSFQKEVLPEEYEKMHPEIIDLGKTFNDFSDTAAAMANLDLFVTSDNGVFNLAGAMGQKTFLLLNRESEWRWFNDEKTTPWYKSVKIFKKDFEKQSWDVLIQKVIEALPIKD